MPHLPSLSTNFWEHIRTVSCFAVLAVISVKRSTYLHLFVLTRLLVSCSTFPRQIHHLHQKPRHFKRQANAHSPPSDTLPPCSRIGSQTSSPARAFIHSLILFKCILRLILQESSQSSYGGSAYADVMVIFKEGIPLKWFITCSGRTVQTELNPIKLLKLLSPSKVICQMLALHVAANQHQTSLSRVTLKTPNQERIRTPHT